MEALGEHHLDDIAGQDIFLGLLDHGAEAGLIHVGGELVRLNRLFLGDKLAGDGLVEADR